MIYHHPQTGVYTMMHASRKVFVMDDFGFLHETKYDLWIVYVPDYLEDI